MGELRSRNGAWVLRTPVDVDAARRRGRRLLKAYWYYQNARSRGFDRASAWRYGYAKSRREELGVW